MIYVPAVLLAGGFGTRLRSKLPFTPKPFAPVGDNFLADQVETLGDGKEWGVALEYSKEQQPHGTAGVSRLAQFLVRACHPLLGQCIPYPWIIRAACCSPVPAL
jgi:NDP-sugar pyrophosphorylase family protein